MKLNRITRLSTQIALIAIVLVAMTSPAFADGGLDAFANKIEQGGVRMAAALLVAAFLVAGGAIALGSDNSGKWAGRAFVAAIFLALAMAGGAAIKAWVASTTGVIQ